MDELDEILDKVQESWTDAKLRVDELERKLAEDWYPLEDDEDLQDPSCAETSILTMYGGNAFIVKGFMDDVVYLPKGYAICKIGGSDETASQV